MVCQRDGGKATVRQVFPSQRASISVTSLASSLSLLLCHTLDPFFLCVTRQIILQVRLLDLLPPFDAFPLFDLFVSEYKNNRKGTSDQTMPVTLELNVPGGSSISTTMCM